MRALGVCDDAHYGRWVITIAFISAGKQDAVNADAPATIIATMCAQAGI
jgi:hypothetical protein